jgi:hypothetical protein
MTLNILTIEPLQAYRSDLIGHIALELKREDRMPSRYEVSRQIHIGCGLERMNLGGIRSYAAQLIVATVYSGVIKRLTSHLASHFDMSLDCRHPENSLQPGR